MLLAFFSLLVQKGEEAPGLGAVRFLPHAVVVLTGPFSLSLQFMTQGKTGSSSPPGGPSKPGSQLDSMLGSLQSDLNKLGVATVAKGVCGACKKPIAGQVMN